MSWNVTMLVLHLLVFSMLVVLLRRGPSAVQVMVVGLLTVAAAVLVYHYCAEVFDWPTAWQVKGVAYSVEHIGVLLYVLRLFIADQERRCLPTLSQSRPSSAR